MKWLIRNILTKDFSKETVRVKDEQEKCAKMRKSIAEESGYYDGRKCFRKISIGKWFDNDSIISITR